MAYVLIVDDESSIRTTLQSFLESDGHSASTAADGRRALELLRERPCDVLLADMIVARRDGDLLNAARHLLPDVQIVIMTAAPTVENAAEAVRAGASDYLLKPISKNAILRAVNHAAEVKALEDEARRLERRNREYQENLEHVVSLRTLELQDSNRRLTEALEELRQAQRQIIQQERLSALGQMASGVAHDFNNSLMPILAFSEILLQHHRTMKEKDIEHDLEMIRTAALDAADVVSRLREFYRPRCRNETLQRVDLGELLDQVATLTRPKWRDDALSHGIEIRLERDVDAVSPIEANAAELREAVTNLIFNAVDAMPKGGVLALRARREGESVAIEVADTGTGMTDEVRQRCFDPFFTTKAERGTGLGLGVTYGIVKRHGGTVRIESQIGRGTTVSIMLPLGTQGMPVRAAAAAGKAPSGLSVLVAEDNPAVLESLVSFLEGDGHKVTAVRDGVDGFDRFRAAWYDVVIADRAMPRMTGDKLLTAIKAAVPGKPVILLSGFDEEDAGRNARPGKEPDAVLGKPVTLSALREAIAKSVGSKKLAGASEPG